MFKLNFSNIPQPLLEMRFGNSLSISFKNKEEQLSYGRKVIDRTLNRMEIQLQLNTRNKLSKWKLYFKIMKSNNVKGLTRSKYRSLLRSLTSESRDNIQKLIQDVQRGIYTPEQAVREFQNVYPGEVTDKYLELIRRRFDEIIPESPTAPVNTDYKRGNIGFQQRGSNIPKDWKYPNVTPDQFNQLSLNQKIALQQNTNLSWSALQRTR
jgi:hypothetical protein